MPSVSRTAFVEHSAARMFDLVNDIAAYPQRFGWCTAARVVEQTQEHIVARLDVGLGAMRTWFMTENSLHPPARIDMQLREGPFRQFVGHWTFQQVTDQTCQIRFELDFEPVSRLLKPLLTLGLQSLADRMVSDFVRVADGESDHDSG